MVETLEYGYSSESTQRELSNEYQHDKVQMVFKNLCVLVLWIKVASAMEGLKWSERALQGVYDWLNPSTAVATFVQCIKKQKIIKTILTLSMWYSLDSSHWVLSDEYPFAMVSVIFQLCCIILYCKI